MREDAAQAPRTDLCFAYSHDATLVDILRWRALHQADQRAYTFLVDGEIEVDSVTYAQLDQRARSIAAILQESAAAGERALLLYQPGLDYISAFLSCLYAGIIAVPAYPPSSDRSLSRIQAIVADAQATLILTDSHTLSKVQRWLEQLPELREMRWIATDRYYQGREEMWQKCKLEPNMLTFLQYTSGSTGTPKGVMVSHGNLIHNSVMMSECWEHSSKSVGISWLPMFHDMGLIAGVLQPLYVGFPAILMAPTAFIQRPVRWLRAISQYKGTTSWAPNFAYELCIRRITAEERGQLDLSSWRVAGNGAEPVRMETIDRFVEVFGPCGFRREAVTPGYGLAEGTLMASSSSVDVVPTLFHLDKTQLEQHRVVDRTEETTSSQAFVGCGSVAKDQKIVIVHPETLVECNQDGVGEIWIAGPSVTQGYWQRPEETERTFHAFLAETGEGPFLRTGDLGFLRQGEVFITGRLKDVIIIRGRNHYPQDIELTVEQSHSSLRTGCGAAFSVEVANEERLVVVQEVLRDYRHTDTIFQTIRQAIAEQHEVEVYAVILIKYGSIFKTSSGKLQRRACRDAFLADRLHVVASDILEESPAVQSQQLPTRVMLLALSPEERRTCLQSYLLIRMGSLLHVDVSNIDIHVPVSTLALDSLKAAELKFYIEDDLGITLPFDDILQERTIAHLATNLLDQLVSATPHVSAPPPIRVTERVSECPLSLSQEQLWILNQLEPDSAFYTIPVALHFEGELNAALLGQCIDKIILRHEILRTTIQMKEGRPVQSVSSVPSGRLTVVDLQGLSKQDERQIEARRQVQQEAQQPFNLSGGALLRVTLLSLQEEEYILLLTMHHIITDGWSVGLFVQELALLYNALRAEDSGPLPPLPVQYVDYALWQREWLKGEVLETQLHYWKQQLDNLPVLDLPTDRPRPALQSYRGATQRFVIPPDLKRKYKELSSQEGVTLFMAVLAAFQILLSRYSGQEEIVVGTVVANRPKAELKELLGFFVNTLVLRTKLPGTISFRELLKHIQKICLDAYSHQDLSFSKLVAELQPERDLSRNPLFQVAFTWQRDVLEGLEISGLVLRPFEIDGATAKFDLSMDMVDSEQALVGTVEYSTDLFEATTIARLIAHFQLLLEDIAANPDQKLAMYSFLTPEEYQQILRDWNATRTEEPVEACLHTLVEAQVTLTPDAIALVYEDEQLSYGQLNVWANQLAHYLRHLGVGSEVIVGVALERCLLLPISLLAILKAGGAYVPLDPSYPSERLAFMLTNSQVPVLLTSEALRSQIAAVATRRPAKAGSSSAESQPSYQVVYLDTAWSTRKGADTADTLVIDQQPLTNPVVLTTPDNLAYMIYTSGSTGEPKGAMNTHRGICNRLQWMQAAYQLEMSDRVLHKTSISFDVSVWELFWPLLVGAHMVLARPGGQRESRYLVELLIEQQITTLHFVPAMLQTFLEEAGVEQCRSMRQVICSGEALPLTLQQRFFELLEAQLHNLYGPTEAAVDVSAWACERQGEQFSVPIGRPISNIHLYVLDGQMQPVPVGVAGELYIGGIGLARGYYRRPEWSAERFVPNPFVETEAKQVEPDGNWTRLYRTGDRVRWLEQGMLEYLGRMDYQVKIRGNRIEIGEIEAVLEQHPQVRTAVVVVQATTSGDRQLVAYIVGAQLQAGPSSRLFRSYLQEKLPDYMIPAYFVALEELPLTPNGKVNRRVLPSPERQQKEGAAFTAPRNPIEELLAEIWGEVLGQAQVSIHDNFFEQGGHSLLATQLIARIQTVLQVELPLHSIFEAPTIAELAQQVESALRNEQRTEVPPLLPVSRAQELPLSFAQQRLWFIDQLEAGNTAYLVPGVRRLEGILNARALEYSLRELVQRHESLRTTFQVRENQPVQVIHPTGNFRLPLIDLQGLSREERDHEARHLVRQETDYPCDLAQGSLLRTYLLRLDIQKHVLLQTMHHIISDGWSNDLFLRELATLYRAFVSRQPSPLPPLPIQYADFAVWQREWLQGKVLESQLVYWRKQLANVPMLDLPTDYPRPPRQTFRGAYQSAPLTTSLYKGLTALSRRENVTLFMLLLAAFQVLLLRYTEQTDLSVGTAIANRTRPELEGLIGFFVNTLVLRTDLSGNPSFLELLRRVREVALEAYAHQDVPFEQLVEELQPERDLSRPPFFQVMFGLQQIPETLESLEGLSVRRLSTEHTVTKFDLTFNIVSSEHDFSTEVEYSTDLFEGNTLNRFLGHWVTLLAGIVAAPDARLADLPLLLEVERQSLLAEWNATQTEGSAPDGLPALFAAQVACHPDSIAMMSEETSLSYEALDRYANRLAHYLQGVGVAPEVLVGVFVERSASLLICMLAVLKAGGGYVPLDPHYPQTRLNAMLADAQVPVVLCGHPLPEFSPALHATVHSLPQVWPLLSGWPVQAPCSDVHADNVAYVIYTSGSTGTPKGVLVTHRGLGNLAQAQAQAFAVHPASHVLQWASLSFDASIAEIIVTLLAGACLDLAPQQQLLPGPELLQMLRTRAITVLTLPPSALALLPVEPLPALATLVVAGEACPADLLPEWAVDRRQIYNAYGPTETTVCASLAALPIDGRKPGIGRPIANTELYVLDAHLQPVPIGIPGELYIGGIGLARGYLHQAEITANRFIPHPFSIQAGARLYKTGDRVRYRANGMLEYLGRLDQQVKLHGYRIEPGEIEALLEQHPAVRAAVVLLREDKVGDPRMVAYLLSNPSLPVPASSEVFSYLRGRLPDYMLPSQILVLEAFPLTPNGKVDRRALPAPEIQHAAPEFVSTVGRTPIEELLTAIWCEVLGDEQVGLHDNFFALGGHSLLATRIISQVRAILQVEISLQHLFETPTIAEMARLVEQSLRGEKSLKMPPLEPVARTQDLPLSFAQQRLWFLDQLGPESTTYLIPAAWRLDGLLNAKVLERSLQEEVRRHESLRTTFEMREDHPVQLIHPAQVLRLPVVDLRGLKREPRSREVELLTRQEAGHPCDLRNGPLLRTYLLRLHSKEHVLLVTMHHIISDAWSNDVFRWELTTLYRAYAAGESSPLSPLPVQYANFALWQRQWLQGEVLKALLDYWRHQLAGVSPLELPTDHPRPPIQTFRGAQQSVQLPNAFYEELIYLSQQEGVTLFMLLLAAFQLLLARYSGQSDISVGTPIANRTRAEVEGLIGFFVNTLVLRADLSDNPLFVEFLARVRKIALEAYVHQDVPFEQLVGELQPERDLSRSPLFQVMLVTQQTTERLEELEGITLSELDIEPGTAKFDLTLFAVSNQDGLRCGVEYNTDLFEPETISRLLIHWQTLLEGIVAEPRTRLSALPLLSETERLRLLVEWNMTRAVELERPYLHSLFEEQVARTPDSVALVAEDAYLTYEQLNRRANQLAHLLRRLGVGPEVIVGVALDRSLLLSISLFGVLKAGGAYLPLDPSYPAHRLAYMLTQAQVPVLLTTESFQQQMAELSAQELRCRFIYLDTAWHGVAAGESSPLTLSIDQQSGANPVNLTTGENLAYVIYTSGSTGEPKGAMNTHRGICNRLRWMQEAYQLTDRDRVLQKTPTSFDVSVWELFWPLLTGAQLVMAQPGGHRDGAYLVHILIDQQITTLHFVPSLLQVFLETEGVEQCESVRQVICSGEVLSYSLQQRFFQCLRAGLHNLYGPTEASIDVTAWSCSPQSQQAIVPIGRPISNIQLYVLASSMQPVPVGVAGELYIGGVGLARGYYQRPELTAERFVPNPFASRESDTQGNGELWTRLYRTGDRVRYHKDGQIEYLGRLDQQVKLRGMRIELGEIEAVLTSYPGVRECVVLLRQDEGADSCLVAYTVGSEMEELPTGHELRSYLQEKLPDYMVPSYFVPLQALPLTPNGKLDRHALSRVKIEKKSSSAYVVPRTYTEQVIATIWQEALNVEQVGIDDNFFDLGGHSLRLTSVQRNLQKMFQRNISIIDLFKHTTVRSLAKYVSDEHVEGLIVPQSAERTNERRLSRQRRRAIRQQYVAEKGSQDE